MATRILRRAHRWSQSILPGLLLSVISLQNITAAPAVWTGLTLDFVRPDGGSPTESENQDPISPNVILTRDTTQGLFNIAKESSYNRNNFLSPLDTLWATDLLPANQGLEISAGNWAALEFKPWRQAYGDAVFADIIGTPAVLRLVTDNVYLDIEFTEWTSSFGGGFAYSRAEGDLPLPMIPTGDYNGNDEVDAADYTLWRDTLGSTVDLRANGDNTGDSEGIIDFADYAYWKAHFGDDVPAGSASATSVVPEPASSLLLVGALLIIAFTQRSSPRGPGQTS